MLLRAIVQGEPGTGKNALLASAADLGYRVVIGSFEPGSEVTQQYTRRPENVHVFSFQDDWKWDDTLGNVRVPKAAIAFELFIYGGRPQGLDKPCDAPLGKPRQWGNDTILVLDTLTMLGTCCRAREEALNPHLMGPLIAYNAACAQEKLCELMLTLECHTIVLSHLNLNSPEAESTFTRNETDLQKKIKRERAALLDTGFFPTMLTRGIARNVILHFPFALLTELDHKAKHASKRVLRTQPVPGYQIKCPLDVEDKLPIETALTTILGKLG